MTSSDNAEDATADTAAELHAHIAQLPMCFISEHMQCTRSVALYGDVHPLSSDEKSVS